MELFFISKSFFYLSPIYTEQYKNSCSRVFKCWTCIFFKLPNAHYGGAKRYSENYQIRTKNFMTSHSLVEQPNENFVNLFLDLSRMMLMSWWQMHNLIFSKLQNDVLNNIWIIFGSLTASSLATARWHIKGHRFFFRFFLFVWNFYLIQFTSECVHNVYIWCKLSR